MPGGIPAVASDGECVTAVPKKDHDELPRYVSYYELREHPEAFVGERIQVYGFLTQGTDAGYLYPTEMEMEAGVFRGIPTELRDPVALKNDVIYRGAIMGLLIIDGLVMTSCGTLQIVDAHIAWVFPRLRDTSLYDQEMYQYIERSDNEDARQWLVAKTGRDFGLDRYAWERWYYEEVVPALSREMYYNIERLFIH